MNHVLCYDLTRELLDVSIFTFTHLNQFSFAADRKLPFTLTVVLKIVA